MFSRQHEQVHIPAFASKLHSQLDGMEVVQLEWSSQQGIHTSTTILGQTAFVSLLKGRKFIPSPFRDIKPRTKTSNLRVLNSPIIPHMYFNTCWFSHACFLSLSDYRGLQQLLCRKRRGLLCKCRDIYPGTLERRETTISFPAFWIWPKIMLW